MQKDFHYGIIKILAFHAGATHEQAEILAYASQYVDDATVHKPVKLVKKPQIESPRLKAGQFDPVCTAHKGLQFLEDFKKSVQEQIYLCFHFLPAEPFNEQENYSYVTKPDSLMARLLLYRAIGIYKDQPNTENLIGLGIALHTFADTWSHQNFTGTHCHEHNDIEHIELWKDKRWIRIKPYKQLINNMFPDIGHAEAYDYPDLPFLRWRYIKDKTKEIILRDNPEIFMQAAQKIFEVLCDVFGQKTQWKALNKKLADFFAKELYKSEQRLNYLQELFPELLLKYDSKEWRNKAIKFITIDDNPVTPALPGNDLKWFWFHNKAYEQRLFVLQKIKPL